MRSFVSNFNVRSSNGNESDIKRKLKKALKKTYNIVNSRMSFLEIESTDNYPNSSIEQGVTTPIIVSEPTQQIGCNDLNLTTIPSTTEIIGNTNAFLTDNETLASIQQEVSTSINVSETTQQIGYNEFNLITVPSTTEIVSSTNAFLTDNETLALIQKEVTTPGNVSEMTRQIGYNDLNISTIPSTTDIMSSANAFITDNTALASINVHPVMAIGAILFVILGSVFGLLLLRKKRSDNQKIIEDGYDLVIDHS
ncbi:hypothetical protein NBO_615g0001 [Nosema bombycis CQ1]|uniref:Uncharacterized protein n=1 Tax=Nosema bombycis (strain CQ1 / CVCC 102059) TaxID=578461 RepID=R0MGS4_NOSB1|nr:hypothetical protein NBO_615g0001 [Nosema bombycis CQ1]|eukprot:EOB11958.1 hypothetical protein NBO_615g0001 [Nosema bombycis CQ1]